ncbi:MAG: N-acetylmuramoyl-L-alanine amidase [Eubacteriales bacterium]
MKKHTPGPRERASRRNLVIMRSCLAVLVLGIFSIAIFAAAGRFSSGSKTQTTTADISSAPTSAVSAAALTIIPTPAGISTASSTDKPETSAATAAASTAASSTAASTAATASSASKASTAAAATVNPSKNTSGEAPDLTGYVVVLDPGHQLHANSDQEALGPDMSGTKDKCSSGTSGVSTGRPEYEVNLEIGLRMRDYLESLGCEVYMTRTVNDVDISNIDRANIALSYAPDVYIRLHCDGSTNSSSRGMGVFVADSGKYAGSLSDWGDLLGRSLSDATGANYRGCSAGSTYSGLNWAADIPSFLLEMGFMSNATDDENLSDSEYQLKICEGVADFISQMPHIST